MAITGIITDKTRRWDDARSSQCRMDECEIRTTEFIREKAIHSECIREQYAVCFAIIEPKRRA